MIKVNRIAFLEMPDGIAFSKLYENENEISISNCEQLCIKVKTYRHDEDDIDGEYKKGDGFDFGFIEFPDTKSFSRDGLFDDEQMFIVFDNEEIDEMIQYLEHSKTINDNNTRV